MIMRTLLAALYSIAIVTVGSFTARAANVVHNGQEIYEKAEDSLKLTWKASNVKTGRYGFPSTKVMYSVHRNNKFMHPESLAGGVVFGCSMTRPKAVSWKELGDPQIGWMLALSDICGNTHSYKILIVVPKNKYNYISYDFTSKKLPIIQSTASGDVRIWSSYQEWGKTGTAGSFFVPELRVVNQREGIYCVPLPSNVTHWPKALPYRSFLGDFYAGLRNLDADVMQSALNAYSDIDFDWLKMQDLPESRGSLMKLTDRIASAAHNLKSIPSGLDLPWDSTNCMSHSPKIRQ
jgi:hypothetical protein